MNIQEDIEVLVVDDEPSFLKLTEVFLDQVDRWLEVDGVLSSYEALELFSDYDCLVSDYQMPGLDGIELLEKIRNEFESDIPFIMFTGKGREEIAMEALNIGADRYIQKGGDPKTQFHELAHSIVSTTKERRMEKKYKQEKRRAEKYFETAQVIMVVIDLDGEIIQANQKTCQLLGYTKEELVGKDWISNFVPERNRQQARETHQHFLKTGEKNFAEKSPVITRSGEERIISWHNSTIENEKNDVIASINSGIDVTEELSREKEIKEKTWMLEGMLNGIMDIVAFQLPDHTTIKINQKGLELIEDSYNEAVGEKCYKLVGKQEPCEECPAEKSIETKKREITEKYFPELDRHLEVITTPILNENNKVEFIIEHARDLSRIKELAKKHRLIKKSVEQATIEIYWITPHGEFRYTNKAVQNKLGYTKKELKGMYVWDVDPEYPKKRREYHYQKVKEKGSTTFETKHKTKNGEIYPVQVTSHYLEHEGQEFELAFAKDITEQKRKQKRQKFLHRLLRHDISNKCQIIQGYLDLIDKEKIPEKDREIIDKIKQSANEQNQIIEKVRTLRKIDKEKTKPIDINKTIEGTIKTNKPQAQKNNIEIKNQTPKQTKAIAGNLLKEVINNIITNAIKHAECSQIQIKTQETPNNIKITIEDDGKGIPEQRKQKIFKKGYKAGKNKGTGLGLHITKKIIKGYNGQIKVKNSPTGGAKFDIYLQKP
ncbi:Signal transduction histidine kinase containing REC and PAS domain [Methanonatronarchaeum thermophilum]|uniref:Signal transduction histidine kinase containing REC and PAS domain n=1 Tax=Methanonatronarchaeum thermophilum TaxID=1927129 RepID=A0A1Y3GAV6_9EURY|nr:PAS domain S-box protein [Methanonatronarchaeum thermophilum]OUJ18397.1 Signal transduction histidine kinase containing REC and PAS domain [Methanonatronarchaeum thermophilum]